MCLHIEDRQRRVMGGVTMYVYVCIYIYIYVYIYIEI